MKTCSKITYPNSSRCIKIPIRTSFFNFLLKTIIFSLDKFSSKLTRIFSKYFFKLINFNEIIITYAIIKVSENIIVANRKYMTGMKNNLKAVA